MTGFLETIITDRASGINLKKFKSGKFKPFVFAKPGSN